MRTLLRVLPLLCLAACGTETGQRPGGVPSVVAPDSAGLLPTAPLARPPALALRPFRGAEGALDSVHVLRGGGHVQTLPGAADAEPPWAERADLDTVDINFDGFVDISQLIVAGATGNTMYSWWLFDPDSGRFVASPEYSTKIGGYLLEPDLKLVTTRSNGGHAGALFEESTYQPRGRTLVLVAETRQDWNEKIERYLLTRGALENGRWVEKVDTFTVETLQGPTDG